jgi:hypothetical protein
MFRSGDFGVTSMDQQTDIELDQADEEILTYTVSDEALEVAARTERGPTWAAPTHVHRCC